MQSQERKEEAVKRDAGIWTNRKITIHGVEREAPSATRSFPGRASACTRPNMQLPISQCPALSVTGQRPQQRVTHCLLDVCRSSKVTEHWAVIREADRPTGVAAVQW
jgi:hypothetical protein